MPAKVDTFKRPISETTNNLKRWFISANLRCYSDVLWGEKE